MSGGDDPRRQAPRLVHRLGMALRFTDVFTGAPITVPLEVTVPARGWRAVRVERDATYRLLFTHQAVPNGTFDLAVTAPGGEYLSHEPIQVTLPVVPSAPPPPVLRQDYLLTRPLWPSRLVRPPAGETAVLARVVNAGGNPVAGVQVRLFAAGSPPPAAPYALTDIRGELLFRLPWLRGSTSGGVVTPPPNLAVQVRDPSGPIHPVVPSTFAPAAGRVQVRVLQIP